MSPLRFARVLRQGIVVSLIVMLVPALSLAQTRKTTTAGSTAAGAAVDQGATVGKGKIKIRKPEYTKVKTPEYSVQVQEPSANAKDWARIAVPFDTDAEWTDDLEFRYYVVVKNPKTSAYLMFTASVTYIDVPKGKDNISTMFLRPKTVERYGDVERAAVEVYLKGELVDAVSSESGAQQWWKTAKVRTVEGVLLNREQTPFACCAWDNNPAIKPVR